MVFMFKKSIATTILLHVAMRFVMIIVTIIVVIFVEKELSFGMLILGLGLLFIIELWMQYVVLKKNVMNPLNMFISEAHAMANNDVQRVNLYDIYLLEEQKNEWGVLAKSFREMRQNINKTNELNQQYRLYLEYEIANRTAQLEKTNRELQALIEKEQSTEIEKSHFLAMLAHELKSPLATIEFAIENIQRSKNPEIIELSFKHVRKATQDMAVITQRCLQVDKLEQPNSIVMDTTFSMERLIYDLIKGFEEASRLQIKITSSLSVTSDELLYQIIIGNLIENALKYSPEKSVVAILVKKSSEPAGILISVSNEIGKAGKPDAAKVFEKYYRHTNAQRLRGTGLGLWLVRGVTTQLGGNVNYIEHNNKVKFQVWLPQ